MNYKFIQPVSMRVTKEQYERELREPLLKMGYEENMIKKWEDIPILVTNLGSTRRHLSNTTESLKTKHHRYFITDYNPELFLAIAAMTDNESPIIGEWLVCIDEMAYIISGYKIGEFVKNGNPNITLALFRRATIQELIEKFTNKETIKEDSMKKELTQELIKDLKNLIAPENVEKFDKLMGIKKPIPKKEELKTGDKVVFRNGDVYLVIKDCNTMHYGGQLFVIVCLKGEGGFMTCESYEDNLIMSDREYKRYDIMKIYRDGDAFISGYTLNQRIDGYNLIWSRD